MSGNSTGGLQRLDFGDTSNGARLQHLFRYAQVGRCVNGVAHDVNNHLGAAMAYAELALMEPDLGQETQEHMEKIIAAIDKCGRLVTTLTDVARPLKTNENMVDMNRLVCDVLLLREYAFRAAKIQVSTDLAPNLPSLLADGPKVQLALLYILTNMEEYFAQTEGAGAIAIRSYRNGEHVCVELKSNGAPIPDAIRETMFESYTTSKSEENAGMGLALALEMVQEHQGDLAYDPDRGFLLQLPIAS